MQLEQPLSALLVIGMHKGSLALGVHMRCVWSSRFVKKFEGEKRKMERKGKEKKRRVFDDVAMGNLYLQGSRLPTSSTDSKLALDLLQLILLDKTRMRAIAHVNLPMIGS
jgi:hypothetical protein